MNEVPIPDGMNEEEALILWQAFLKFAEESGVSLDHKDDWLPWWQCYSSGAVAMMEIFH